MIRLLKEYILPLNNYLISLYFLAIYLINMYRIDYVLIGVVRELVTIPLLLVLPVNLVASIVILIKEKRFNLFYMLGIVVSLTCLALILKSI